MGEALKSKLNPIVILALWITSMILLTPIFMIISNMGASCGEQKPLTTLAEMIVVTSYGAAIISLLTPFFYTDWFKRNWKWFCVITLLFVFATVKDILDKNSQSTYSSTDIKTIVNGEEIRTKTEYYDDFKTVRSIQIWKSNKKDSLWQTFSRDGKIIKEQRFNKDLLVPE